MNRFSANYKLIVLSFLCAFAQSVWAQTHVSTEADLNEAITLGKSVVLDDDIQLESCVSIPNAATLTIDLNEHTLSRNLSGSSGTGQVISVEKGGNFTLKNGTIKGGRASSGGGVCNEGVTTVNNCVITENNAGIDGGGGLCNFPGATMTVVDSEILNNSSSM